MDTEGLAQVELVVKAGDIRDTGSTPGLGRSPGGGNGNPFQYSCLKSPMEGSLVEYNPWGCKDLDTTERLSTLHKLDSFSNSTSGLIMH